MLFAVLHGIVVLSLTKANKYTVFLLQIKVCNVFIHLCWLTLFMVYNSLTKTF